MHLFGGQPEERCAHPETELAEPAATGGPMASFPLMRVARGRQGLCGPKARLRERKA